MSMSNYIQRFISGFFFKERSNKINNSMTTEKEYMNLITKHCRYLYQKHNSVYLLTTITTNMSAYDYGKSMFIMSQTL